MTHRKFLLPAALLILAAAILLSLCAGRYPLTPADLLSGDEMSWKVLMVLRVPRTIMAVTAGAGLAFAGSVYQLLFRNPLAAPDIIGVSSGASVGASVSILFFGGGLLTNTLLAFTGGLTAVGLALLLARGGDRRNTATFVLAGIAVNALAEAAVMFLKYAADPNQQLAAIDFWTMGSLAGITREKILPTVLCVGFCGGLLFLLQRQITLLALDPDEAALLGVDVDRMRHLVLILATLTVASIVSVTGLISFIGLLAPHIARLLDRRGGSHALALSGVIGAALLLLADCAARTLSSSEIPISILTSFVGAPFLIWLIARRDSVWQ